MQQQFTQTVTPCGGQGGQTGLIPLHLIQDALATPADGSSVPSSQAQSSFPWGPSPPLSEAIGPINGPVAAPQATVAANGARGRTVQPAAFRMHPAALAQIYHQRTLHDFITHPKPSQGDEKRARLHMQQQQQHMVPFTVNSSLSSVQDSQLVNSQLAAAAAAAAAATQCG
eukprot:11007871-Prorocentrum_lima.AAC.1